MNNKITPESRLKRQVTTIQDIETAQENLFKTISNIRFEGSARREEERKILDNFEKKLRITMKEKQISEESIPTFSTLWEIMELADENRKEIKDLMQVVLDNLKMSVEIDEINKEMKETGQLSDEKKRRNEELIISLKNNQKWLKQRLEKLKEKQQKESQLIEKLSKLVKESMQKLRSMLEIIKDEEEE